jgi:hypothetical protein
MVWQGLTNDGIHVFKSDRHRRALCNSGVKPICVPRASSFELTQPAAKRGSSCRATPTCAAVPIAPGKLTLGEVRDGGDMILPIAPGCG